MCLYVYICTYVNMPMHMCACVTSCVGCVTRYLYTRDGGQVSSGLTISIIKGVLFIRFNLSLVGGLGSRVRSVSGEYQIDRLPGPRSGSETYVQVNLRVTVGIDTCIKLMLVVAVALFRFVGPGGQAPVGLVTWVCT